MNTRRWVQLAVVTTVAVTATVLATAGPAAAAPQRCNAILDRIDYDWDQFNEFAAWAGINAHDGDWQDYEENMRAAGDWAMAARMNTETAQRTGCM
jgi:hypothetical protein